MPIRINLKEIFPSDPQEINVEKVNFNFNKLLELGIGTPGPIGLTGPQGPAGPIGLTGPQGIRGATWWVDSGVPSTHVFPGLLDGDLYLDNLTFNVWRWDEATSTWTLEVGISTIIDNYLAANGSPFVKDLKDIPSLNKDSRFITFSKRDHTNDITRGIGSSSLNNSLFLTNFNEEEPSQFTLPLIWPPNIKSLYNSIVSIFANHSDNQISSAADLGRYHLELGSLYNDSVNTQISDINHNLKIKYVKSFNSGPQVGLWNEWINTANLSVSVQENQPQANILQNGIFNFITPKFNDNLSPFPAVIVPVQDELYTRFGPWESHAEISNLANIVADGISFELFYSSLAANIGIAQTYVSSYTRLNGKDLFMLDTHPNLFGILLDDDTYIIGNTNVIGKVSIGDIDPISYLTVSGNASIGSGYNAILAPTNGAIIEGTVGIGNSAPLSKLSVSGNAAVGVGYDAILAPTNGAIIEGTVGIGTSAPLSKLSVSGNTSIGSGYATNAAPTNGAIIEGTVGIGTSSPASDLTVSGNASIGVGYNAILAPTDGAIIEGDLGIGTFSPASKVEIVGENDLPITSGTTQTKGLRLSVDGGSSVLDMGVNSADDQAWLQSTDSSDLSIKHPLLINPNGGTVAINTLFPDTSSRLHVNGKVKITDGTQPGIGITATLTTSGDGLASWTPLSSIGVPVGAMMMWFSASAPTGWLICDGTSVSSGSYPILFGMVGSNTPDLRGAFIVGAGFGGANSGGEDYFLHDTGGENSVTLSTGEIPAHTHGLTSVTIDQHTHPFSGTTDGARAYINTATNDNNNETSRLLRGASDDLSLDDTGQQTDHNHTFSGTTSNNTAGITGVTGDTDNNTGGGGSHENRPPYFALTYIIKHD